MPNIWMFDQAYYSLAKHLFTQRPFLNSESVVIGLFDKFNVNASSIRANGFLLIKSNPFSLQAKILVKMFEWFQYKSQQENFTVLWCRHRPVIIRFDVLKKQRVEMNRNLAVLCYALIYLSVDVIHIFRTKYQLFLITLRMSVKSVSLTIGKGCYHRSRKIFEHDTMQCTVQKPLE